MRTDAMQQISIRLSLQCCEGCRRIPMTPQLTCEIRIEPGGIIRCLSLTLFVSLTRLGLVLLRSHRGPLGMLLGDQGLDPFSQQSARIGCICVGWCLPQVTYFSCFKDSQVERYAIQFCWYWFR